MVGVYIIFKSVDVKFYLELFLINYRSLFLVDLVGRFLVEKLKRN